MTPATINLWLNGAAVVWVAITSMCILESRLIGCCTLYVNLTLIVMLITFFGFKMANKFCFCPYENIKYPKHHHVFIPEPKATLRLWLWSDVAQKLLAHLMHTNSRL